MRYLNLQHWARGLFAFSFVLFGLCVESAASGGQSKRVLSSRSTTSKSVSPTMRKPAPSTPSKPTGSNPSPLPKAEPVRISYGIRGGGWLTLENTPPESIEATGVAPYPHNVASRAQARVQARRAAILDAQRQLVEQLYGVNIASNSRLTERGLQEEVQANARGMVQGAQVLSERDWGDSYEVTLRWSPPPPTVRLPTPQGAPPVRSEPRPTPIPSPTHGYTGVIIDARGLGLQPSMSPYIRDAYGNTLWGNLDIEPEVVIEYGLAGWARTQDELSHPTLASRLGNNPLWLKAVGVQGAGRNEVILSQNDAERLIRENAQGGFLERLAVVFLY